MRLLSFSKLQECVRDFIQMITIIYRRKSIKKKIMLLLKLRPEIIPTNIFETHADLFYVGMIIAFINCDHNFNYEME